MGMRDDGPAHQPRIYCWLGGKEANGFVLDPVIHVRGDGAGRHGARIVQRQVAEDAAVNDVLIWLDKGRYPSPWHFVAEATAGHLSVPVAQHFPWQSLTAYSSRLMVAHSMAIPKFNYELDHGTAEYGCSKEVHPDNGRDPRIAAHASLGWHGNSEPCAFALRDLAFIHSHFILPSGICRPHTREYLWDLHGEHTVIGRNGLNFHARFPAEIAYPAADQGAYMPGIFFAAPISHAQFHRSADKETIARAVRAGFVVMLYDEPTETPRKDTSK